MGERFLGSEVLQVITPEEEQAIAHFEKDMPVVVERRGGTIDATGWVFDSLIGNLVFVKKMETNEGQHVPIAEFLALNVNHVNL